MFPVQRIRHRLFVDPQNFTIRDRGRGSHAQSLTSQRAFPKETSVRQQANGCLPAGRRDDGQLHFAVLDIEDRVRHISLCEDSLFPGESEALTALANSCKEVCGIELAAI